MMLFLRRVSAGNWWYPCTTGRDICDQQCCAKSKSWVAQWTTHCGWLCSQFLLWWSIHYMVRNLWQRNTAIAFVLLVQYDTENVQHVNFRTSPVASGYTVLFMDRIWRHARWHGPVHYNDIIMSVMAFQIPGVSIVCSTVCSGADQRNQQSSASLAFVRGIHRWFPSQRASNAENVSIWWRHHVGAFRKTPAACNGVVRLHHRVWVQKQNNPVYFKKCLLTPNRPNTHITCIKSIFTVGKFLVVLFMLVYPWPTSDGRVLSL